MFIVDFIIIAKNWNQLKCLPTREEIYFSCGTFMQWDTTHKIKKPSTTWWISKPWCWVKQECMLHDSIYMGLKMAELKPWLEIDQQLPVETGNYLQRAMIEGSGMIEIVYILVGILVTRYVNLSEFIGLNTKDSCTSQNITSIKIHLNWKIKPNWDGKLRSQNTWICGQALWLINSGSKIAGVPTLVLFSPFYSNRTSEFVFGNTSTWNHYPASLATSRRNMHLFCPFLFPDGRNAAIGIGALLAIFNHEITLIMKLQWMDQQDRVLFHPELSTS